MAKAPKIKSLPDILTVPEIERLIAATRKRRLPGVSISNLFHETTPERNTGIAGR